MFPKPRRKQVKHYEKYLSPGEELAYIARIGDRYYWSLLVSYLLTFVMLLAFMVVTTQYALLPLWIAVPIGLSSIIIIFPLLKILHLRHSLTYLFTNRRIIIKKGIFSLMITTAPYDKITHIQVEQKFLDHVFYDTGTIFVHTAGPTPVEMKLVKIEKPIAIKNMLDDLIHQERLTTAAPISQPWPQAQTSDVITLS